jgi:hypothetical protein
VDLKVLHPKYGQSLWLDYIRRHLLQSGEFARLVEDDGIRGVTSNPSIFGSSSKAGVDDQAAFLRGMGGAMPRARNRRMPSSLRIGLAVMKRSLRRR